MTTIKVTDYTEFAKGEEPYSEGYFMADDKFTKFTDADTAQSLKVNPKVYLGTETFHVFESYGGVVLVPDYQLEVVGD